MATFDEDLCNHLKTSGVVGSNVYIDSFPAPTAPSPNIIGIIAAGEVINSPEIISYTKRFVISGSSVTAYQKAYDILNLYFPRTLKPTKLQETARILASCTIKKVFVEKMPSLTKNVGNIFYADLLLRFIVAY